MAFLGPFFDSILTSRGLMEGQSIQLGYGWKASAFELETRENGQRYKTIIFLEGFSAYFVPHRNASFVLLA